MDKRIDYIKYAYPGSLHSQRVYAEISPLEYIFSDKFGKEAHRKTVTSEKQHPYTVWYFVEIWGPPADWFWKQYGPRLLAFENVRITRLDYRIGGIDEAALTALASAPPSSRKVTFQTFRSKPRNKSGDRDAGGSGWALGSHKSNSRLVCYKRGKEPAAVEHCTRGPLLTNLLSDARSAARRFVQTGDIEARNECLDRAERALYDEFSQRVETHFGQGALHYLLGLTPQPARVQEAAIEQAESILGAVGINLSDLISGQLSFLDSLDDQARLFGTTATEYENPEGMDEEDALPA